MELLKRLKLLLTIEDDSQDALLLTYLDIAAQKLLDRVYPYDEEKVLPNRYNLKQIEIAQYLFNKRGADGQTSHGENGISRSYASADVPEDLLKGVVSMVGVL